MKKINKIAFSIFAIMICFSSYYVYAYNTTQIDDGYNRVHDGDKSGEEYSCEASISANDNAYIWVRDRNWFFRDNVYVGAEGFSNPQINHTSISKIAIHVNWMVESWSTTTGVDNIRIVFFSSDNINHEEQILSGQPACSSEYENTVTIESGDLFDDIVAGDYVDEVRVYMDCGDRGFWGPNIYLNVDVIEITYYCT